MSTRTIYDRVEFCEKIITSIENSKETSAFILYSQVGVGKSSVCKKIENIINSSNNKTIIRITSPQENENIQEGAFLKNIFEHIHNYYEKIYSNSKLKDKYKYRKYTFSTFLKKQGTFFTLAQCIYNNINNFVSSYGKPLYLIVYGVKYLLEYVLLKIGIIQKIKIDILHDNKLMSEYIRYVLNFGDLILNIDNIQNFDNVSLNYFLECLMDTIEKNNFMLFEFTLLADNTNYEVLLKQKHEFENANIAVSTLELENLDIKNVIKVARDYCNISDDLFEVAIKNNYSKLYKGNLKKVEHFASIYSENISLETDPTFERLKKLSSKELYILAIIIINNAILKEKTLKYIIENSNNDFMIDYNIDVNKFCEDGEFVEKTEDNIRIIHSSTIDVWYENIHVFKKYELLAYRNCQMIYNRILNNKLFYTLSKKECIFLLFQLYSKFEISKISTILSHIDEIIYDFLSLEELSIYLKKLISSINDSEESVDFLYKIIDISIKFQLYDIEGFCLYKIGNINGNVFDEKYNLYQYIKLFLSEEYEGILELIEETKKHDISKEFEAYNILFEIVSNRALNNKEKYSFLVELADKNNSFKTMIHYAYFLRLAEAYDERNLAIPKVEESIKLFQKANLPMQVAKSQVSLAFLYAITGRIDEAETELNLSEKVLLKNIENKYVFNINKACIQLLNGNFSNETWTLLDEVEKCTRMKFDRIAIIINKLIWCIENSDYIKGKYLQNKGLELLETESDRHIHAIFYYNCFVFNNAMGNLNDEQYFYDLAYENRKYCKTLKARMENVKFVEDGTTFLLSKPWHVCFVSYWYFDYLEDLK